MAKRPEKLRVCLVASAGGHMMQLLKLSNCWAPYEVSYVSTMDLVAKKLEKHGRVYITGECNRQHPFKSLLVLARCTRIALKEQPDVVISTGAAPGCMLCLVSKIILGTKIIWVDSIANVERLSLSGWIVRPFADLILTQWPELSEHYDNVEYVGAII